MQAVLIPAILAAFQQQVVATNAVFRKLSTCSDQFSVWEEELFVYKMRDFLMYNREFIVYSYNMAVRYFQQS